MGIVATAVLAGDGNVFGVIGRAAGALRRAGRDADAKELIERATDAGTYHDAMAIVLSYDRPSDDEDDDGPNGLGSDGVD